ncbi:MAG TPA: DMT family transporter, partial [Dehalococcoidia bacterium]
MQHTTKPIDLRIAIVLLVCGITGGSVFILVKALVGEVTALQLVAARVLLAAAVVGTVMVMGGRTPRFSRSLLFGATVLALSDAIIPYVLIALAAPHVRASTSALLVATMPLFTAAFVSVTDRTRLEPQTLAGLALGVVGAAILAGPKALDFADSATLAMFAVLLSAASYAASAVYSRVVLREADPIGLSAVKFAIASLIIVPFVATREGFTSFSGLSAEGWLGLLGIGCFATGLARCGYVWVIAEAGSVAASLLTYIVPAAAMVLGWLFLHETPGASAILGAVAVAAAVTCVLRGVSPSSPERSRSPRA